MAQNCTIKRTTTGDKDFRLLVSCLDHELWSELKEDQATYDPFNNVENISTAMLVYLDNTPAACGCFKKFDDVTAEVKRMFVQKPFRGQGLSKMVLRELETWAIEDGFHFAVLETSVRFKVARSLYEKSGYRIMPNYPPYAGLPESICMKKELQNIEQTVS